jgi:arsenate reductase-like glutaredoxin family protein
LQKALDAQGKEIEALKSQAETAEIVEIAKSIVSDPSDEFVAELRDISKALKPEQFQKHVERQRSAALLAKNSDMLTTISKGKGAADVSPGQAIEAKAREIVAKSEKSWDDPSVRSEAIQKAMAENPDLTRRYDREMTKSAAAVGGADED